MSELEAERSEVREGGWSGGSASSCADVSTSSLRLFGAAALTKDQACYTTLVNKTRDLLQLQQNGVSCLVHNKRTKISLIARKLPLPI